MLEVCQTLLKEHSGVYCQTHINENQLEVAAVAELFPGSSDYLSVYERFGLAGPRTVLAHNVYATESELDRLASHQTAVAHCPCSNAALGSGFFALSRHIDKGITVALGTDVGGGTGFGLLKEGLQSYLLQRLAPSGYPLRAAHMLYLATRAGALALGLEATCGDFTPGKAADFVYLKPPAASPLANVVNHAENTDHVLAALFTLGGSETVQEVRVQGELVYAAGTNS
jgi:guanine deaminase